MSEEEQLLIYKEKISEFIKQTNVEFVIDFKGERDQKEWAEGYFYKPLPVYFNEKPSETLREYFEIQIQTLRGKIKVGYWGKMHEWFRDTRLLSAAYLDKIKNVPYEEWLSVNLTKYPRHDVILYRLQTEDPLTFEEFCAKNNYSNNFIVEEFFLECKKGYESLKEIFTPEQIAELNRIKTYAPPDEMKYPRT